MGTYNSAVITNAGQAMIAQSFVGSDLRFTTVKTSAYVYPTGTNLSELVTINSIKQSKGITGAAVYNSRVIKVSAMVDNAGITTAYDINTIGVYASVGTDAEQLFAVITAIDADTMPAFNNRPYSYIYELNLTVGSTENLTVTVNNAGFVNVNDLNVAVEGKLSTDGNASQVTVDFTSGDLADSDVTKDTGYTSVATVGSGETATSLLTKISNVIKNVRWIYKFLGTSDISTVGNGTVTNAVTTLKSNVVSLNDAIGNIIFAGSAKKVRIANNSTSTDISIRALHDDGSASGFSATTQGIALQKFPVSGDASNILKVNFLHTTTTANGTSTTTATLTPGLVNYAYRKLIATCNGGSNGGRSIVSAIPTSANTVTINWDGNTPASGDIQISLMYWE